MSEEQRRMERRKREAAWQLALAAGAFLAFLAALRNLSGGWVWLLWVNGAMGVGAPLMFFIHAVLDVLRPPETGRKSP